MVKQTEIRAAQGILERGIRAKVRAPFFLRWIGVKTIPLTLRRLYGGTLLRVAEYYLSAGIKDAQLKEISTEEALELMTKHGDAIYKAIACALLNNALLIRCFLKPMASYLKNHLQLSEALMLLDVTILYSGVADFMSITRSLRSLMITEPTNQGQKMAGS